MSDKNVVKTEDGIDESKQLSEEQELRQKKGDKGKAKVVVDENMDDDDDDKKDDVDENVDDVKDDDDVKEDIDVSSDIDALVEGEDLSEDFKKKATLLYKTSIEAKYNELKEDLQESYNARLVEHIEQIENDLVEKVDKYLDYVVSQWMDTNEVAIETGARTDVTESFIKNLKDVFVNHYVEVPEGKEDILATVQAEAVESKSKLDESITENINLVSENKQLKKVAAIDVLSVNLTVSQKEKFEGLLDSVEFNESFDENASTIYSSHFAKSTPSKSPEVPGGDLLESTEVTNTSMDNYTNFIKTQNTKFKK